MGEVGGPFSFHTHPLAWTAVAALALAYLWAVRQPRWRATRREALCFTGGLGVLLVTFSSPVADIATHYSLTALVLQRLLLVLAVPPLLLQGTPQALLAALTRPAPIDTALRLVMRPVVAVAVVTVVAVGTLTSGAVAVAASSTPARAGLDLALLAAGFVLWAPISRRLPGTERPSTLGQAGYLVIQSILPSFLAVVWIFSRHPLYAPYAHARLFGMAPLTDQQLAGFTAKLATIAVLWTVALVLLLRADRAEAEGDDTEPLTWADVERQLERVERAERRAQRVRQPGTGSSP